MLPKACQCVSYGDISHVWGVDLGPSLIYQYLEPYVRGEPVTLGASMRANCYGHSVRGTIVGDLYASFLTHVSYRCWTLVQASICLLSSVKNPACCKWLHSMRRKLCVRGLDSVIVTWCIPDKVDPGELV